MGVQEKKAGHCKRAANIAADTRPAIQIEKTTVERKDIRPVFLDFDIWGKSSCGPDAKLSAAKAQCKNPAKKSVVSQENL